MRLLSTGWFQEGRLFR